MSTRVPVDSVYGRDAAGEKYADLARRSDVVTIKERVARVHEVSLSSTPLRALPDSPFPVSTTLRGRLCHRQAGKYLVAQSSVVRQLITVDPYFAAGEQQLCSDHAAARLVQ